MNSYQMIAVGVISLLYFIGSANIIDKYILPKLYDRGFVAFVLTFTLMMSSVLGFFGGLFLIGVGICGAI